MGPRVPHVSLTGTKVCDVGVKHTEFKGSSFRGFKKGNIIVIIPKRGLAWAGIHHESKICGVFGVFAFAIFLLVSAPIFLEHRGRFEFEHHST
jgi:hypothetical protein